jgi:hypothetical protein
VDLRELIAQSFGAEAAEEWSRSTVGDEDKAKLAEAAHRVLELFPGRMPGACSPMSAMYSIALEAMGERPAYVIAGSLYVGDTRVFGEDGELDGKAVFSQTNLSWNGHAWVVYGDYLADVSIGRTATSDKSPPALKEHVERLGATGRGLFAYKLGTESREGFRYEPQYALTRDEVNALGRGAMAIVSDTGSA